jgi:hypothetical protein
MIFPHFPQITNISPFLGKYTITEGVLDRGYVSWGNLEVAGTVDAHIYHSLLSRIYRIKPYFYQTYLNNSI